MKKLLLALMVSLATALAMPVSALAATGYKVVFDTCGGTEVSTKTGVQPEDKVLDGVANPTRETSVPYYDFKGWKCGDVDVNSSTTFSEIKGQADDDGSVTVTAQWQKRTYSIMYYSFEIDPGDPVIDTFESGSYIRIRGAGIFKRAGRKQVEWLESIYRSWQFGDLYDQEENVILLPTWEDLSYNVTFSDTGDSTIEGKTGLSKDSKVLDGIGAPKRAGYVFAGWKCGDAEVTSDSTCIGLSPYDADITLTAQWTKLSYNVAFSDTGDSTIAPKSGLSGESRPLDGVSDPVRRGYKFLGWKCGDKVVTASSTCADVSPYDADITLTAQWGQVYTIEFDSAGGTSVSQKDNVTASDVVLDGVANPTRETSVPYYDFTGWKCGDKSVNALTTVSDLADQASTDNTITLTAQWDVRTYGVAYTKDESADSSRQITDIFSSGMPYTFRDYYNKKSGYVQTAWKDCDRDLTFQARDAWNETVPDFTRVLRLEPAYTKIAYVVTFDSRGGSDVQKKTGLDLDSKVLDGVGDPTRAGYVFRGWKCGDVDVAASTTCVDLSAYDADITLVAQWGEASYSVTFSDTGDSTIAPKSGLGKDSKVLDGVGDPTRAGYVFRGWKCGDTDVSPTSTCGQVSPYNTEITLTAQWDARSYKVEFDSAGGSEVAAREGVTISDKVLDGVSDSVRDGFEFVGWKCGDIDVTAATTLGELLGSAKDDTVTLTAQWAKSDDPDDDPDKDSDRDSGKKSDKESGKGASGDGTIVGPEDGSEDASVSPATGDTSNATPVAALFAVGIALCLFGLARRREK